MRVSDATPIAAPADLVWAVTVDVERWPEWTPTVSSVTRRDTGPFGPGSVVLLKQPLQPASDWVVSEYAAGRMFSWQSRRRGLRLTGTHEVVSEGSGSTSVLRLDAEGALAVLFWPLLRIATRRALAEENRGLKARCEAMAKPR